ncbi:MAG: hypothetical protein PF518_19310, partial [Spirochaetaceae bacterium]|nr:hypothetical protein [Spirochaetaceae bacterium]
MKIKSKLLLLISSLMGAVVISIAVFVLLQFNITQMEKEKEYLDVLGKALHKELSEVSTFFFPDTPFQSQIENYNQARLIKQGSLSNLTKIKALRKISVTINDSLQSIEKLEELQSSTIDRFNSSAEKLIENAKKINPLSSDFYFDDVESKQIMDSEFYPAFVFYTQQVQNNTMNMINVLESSISVLNNQYEVIAEAIDQRTQISYMVTAILILITILISFIVA